MAEAGQRLGQLLMRAGVITDAQLNDALEVHRATGSPIGRVLVDLGYASQGDILSVMAQQIGIEYIDFAERRPEPRRRRARARELASRYTLMPVEIRDGVLVVAMADPQNVLALDDLRIITGYDIKPAISTKDDILAAIEEYYKVAEHAEERPVPRHRGHLGRGARTAHRTSTSEAPAVKLVNYIIQKAVADRASDIHIEPQENDLRVRFRIDGVLHEVMPPAPKSIQTSIISRFKIMADMDIAESRKPQDGHCAVTVGGHKVDFRVSTLPTVYGERVVLRILRKDSILLRLTDLGFLPAVARALRGARSPSPTARSWSPVRRARASRRRSTRRSTCSTTRRATSSPPRTRSSTGFRASTSARSTTRAGLTFARALRSFLRCSPDVILVGEIRDQETAKIAIESALTGHLVLSTLHTNDCRRRRHPSDRDGRRAVPRLLGGRLRARAAARAQAVPGLQGGVDAQAAKCSSKRAITADNLPETVYRAVGCKKCGGTGYRGRIGVHEVLMMSEEISRLCVEEATAEEIKAGRDRAGNAHAEAGRS